MGTGGYTSAISMKVTRRVAFSANTLRRKHGLPIGKPRISWDAITAIATAASAIISVVVLYVAVRSLQYTANQLEDLRKDSQAQHIIEKVEEFNSPQFRAVRRALAEQRLNHSEDGLKKLDTEDAPGEIADELTFCNDLGILTRHGELSAYDVWAEFSYWLFPFYTDSEPYIKADQKDAPASWSNCDYLMEQVRKVEMQEDAGKQLIQKDKDIADFYASELEENRPRTAIEEKR